MCREWGYGCGLLHDIGKYSEKFQKRLRSGPITDHATAGAQELYRRKKYIGAYCISGHHSGLLDGGSSADVGGEATLKGRMEKTLEDYLDTEKFMTDKAVLILWTCCMSTCFIMWKHGWSMRMTIL